MLANPLNVTYDCQLDNPSGDGWRECFSSSCAMAAKFWLPELEINDYHRRRPNYGDSTDASAQIRTLESFGLQGSLCAGGQRGEAQGTDRSRAACTCGIPPPRLCKRSYGRWALHPGDWIHRHPPDRPRPLWGAGRGEWRLPQKGGTYGKEIRYSWKNWAPRWSVANDHDGWGLDIWMDGKAAPKPAVSVQVTKISAKGLALIKEFEGCRLYGLHLFRRGADHRRRPHRPRREVRNDDYAVRS